MISIVTDSTCDIPHSLVQRNEITVVPAYVNIGERSLKDGVDIGREDFYHKLEMGGSTFKTSSPSPGEFGAVYERLLSKANHIISIHLASQLSGIFSAASVGAGQVDAARITTVDSGQVSMGLGWAVLAAAKAARDSTSREGVLHSTYDALGRVRLYALLDTLSYLARSGRVDIVRAGLGTLLNIKPIVEVKAGNVETKSRIRTWSRATEALSQLALGPAPLSELAVLHTNIKGEAAKLLDRVRPAIQSADGVFIANVTPVIGVHTGPQTLGVAFLLAR